MASEVGPGGRVISTEIDPPRLKQLRKTVAEAKLDHVTVVEAQTHDTGLPPNCCDAIVLRRVYHHLTDPTSLNASSLQSLRPGGPSRAFIEVPQAKSSLIYITLPAGEPRDTCGSDADCTGGLPGLHEGIRHGIQ